MNTRPMVTVAHDDVAGTAVVPASALPRMEKQGWRQVNEEPKKTSFAPRRPVPADPENATPAAAAAKKATPPSRAKKATAKKTTPPKKKPTASTGATTTTEE